MKKTGKNVAILVTVVLLALTAACVLTPEDITPEPAPTPPIPPPGAELGVIEIRVTDPPSPEVISAKVYFSNIEVHKVIGEEGEWITIPIAMEPPRDPPWFDLLEVIDVEQVLGTVTAEAGSYTQIRLDVTKVEVVTIDGDTILAEVPSDKLKIVRPFDVEGGVTTILTLDFDGDKSVILRGKKEALFKPVVRLLIIKEKVEEEEQEGNESSE